MQQFIIEQHFTSNIIIEFGGFLTGPAYRTLQKFRNQRKRGGLGR